MKFSVKLFSRKSRNLLRMSTTCIENLGKRYLNAFYINVVDRARYHDGSYGQAKTEGLPVRKRS